jgi:polysaccharide biosynthesis/export protein
MRRLLFVPGLLLALGLALPGPAPAQSESSGAKRNYIHTLQLADLIRVSIFGEDDLNSIVRIDARGRVNLKLVGEVDLGGLTLTEAQRVVEEAYKDGRFLRNPQVTISVEEYAPREVTIQGAVVNPQRYVLPIESTYTVVELVSRAGGLRDIAKGTAVTVTRILPDGSKKVFTVDVESIIKGRRNARAEDNLLLQPGDIVYVPESLF